MQSQGSGVGTLEKLVGEIMTDSNGGNVLGCAFPKMSLIVV